MELNEYIRVIWRWLWVVVLGVTVATGSTYLAVRDQQPMYTAKARLMVGQVLTEEQPTQSDYWLALNLAQSYTELAYGRTIQDATREALGLEWLPGYTVKQVNSTQLLDLEVTDTDPQRAAAVANELADQLVKHSPSNPSPEDVQRQGFVKQQLDDLEANIEATKGEIDRLQEALSGMFSAREIADTQTQIAALEQKLGSYQNNYGQLLLFMDQGGVNSLSVVERPVVPSSPIASGKMRTILIAAAAGLALAVATAFLLEYLDDTVKSPGDIEKTMRLTTVGNVSRIPGDDLADKLIAAKHPKSPISEAYRVLRTNLQFSSLDKPLRTLVVTSPNPMEGKSTTVANLGVVMAQAGNRVVVVDADLRRPVQHRLFGLENREGLTSLLLSEEPSLNGHLQATGIENLRVLSTGPLPPNPSELLGSRRMATMLERLKEEADVILFDSPPTLAVADAAVLATQADGVLIVTDAGRTRRNAASHAAGQLRQVGANLMGVVLNRLRPGRGGYGYYYYYYHYYGDGKRRKQRGLASLFRRRRSRRIAS